MINRYVTTVVEDAKLVSNHSKKKIIDNEDIRLAVQMYNEQNFCSPPPKGQLILECLFDFLNFPKNHRKI